MTARVRKARPRSPAPQPRAPLLAIVEAPAGATTLASRLTEAELDEALRVAQSLHSLRLTAAIIELRERRAADLLGENAEYRDQLALVQRALDETRRERDRAEAELALVRGGESQHD